MPNLMPSIASQSLTPTRWGRKVREGSATTRATVVLRARPNASGQVLSTATAKSLVQGDPAQANATARVTTTVNP